MRLTHHVIIPLRVPNCAYRAVHPITSTYFQLLSGNMAFSKEKKNGHKSKFLIATGVGLYMNDHTSYRIHPTLHTVKWVPIRPDGNGLEYKHGSGISSLTGQE